MNDVPQWPSNIDQDEIIADILALYPETKRICVVGSFARGEARTEVTGRGFKQGVSDFDLTIELPEEQFQQIWVRDDTSLIKKWAPLEREGKHIVDFLLKPEGTEWKGGQHYCRKAMKLPTPEIEIWRI